MRPTGRERLFTIKDPNGKYIIRKSEVSYFSTKAAAKAVRKAYNGTDENGAEKMETGYRLAKGPDNFDNYRRG